MNALHQLPFGQTVIRLFATILLICISMKIAGAGDRYAFLVGVKQYDKTQLTSLSYTEADVTALADALKTAGYDDANIVLMTQTLGASSARQLPTSQRIRKELDLLLGELESDDTLLLAFSGHGVQFKDEENMYFCPMDANLSERNTLISLEDVYDLLSDSQKCKAQTKILFVDACRDDSQSRKQFSEVPSLQLQQLSEIELEPAGVTQQPDPPGGVAAIFSCSRGEKSYEHPDLEHGIFANFVIEAFSGKGDLDKDGEISLAEMEQYCVKKTQRFARVELGESQTPERRGKVRGLIPLGFFASDPASPKREPPIPVPEMPTKPSHITEGQVLTNSLGMKLVLIPGGEFLMGFSGIESRYGNQRRVHITNPFYIQTTEVTQGQWQALMGTSPWKGKRYAKEGADYAASYVSYSDAIEFCRKLSSRENVVYRLPTEAEWEYACRGGKQTAFSFGASSEELGSYAWHNDIMSRPEEYAHRVGKKRPNGFGLYDMHGNVWEWCNDWYSSDYYLSSPKNDPTGPSTGSYRVGRGGGWSSSAHECRSAHVFRFQPSNRNGSLGFRVVRSAKK